MVIEIGTPVLGFVNDAFFRYVTDLEVFGADRAKEANTSGWGLNIKWRSPKDISCPAHRPTVIGR